MHVTLTPIAVHTDRSYSERFEVHCSGLLRRYGLQQLAIQPVQDALDSANTISIYADVQAADIVVALLSEDLLYALDMLTDQLGNNLILSELEKKAQDTRYRVIPVILSPCSWDAPNSLFWRRQRLPREKETVSKYKNRESAWREVMEGLRVVIEEMLSIPICPRCKQTAPLSRRYCSCGTQLY